MCYTGRLIQRIARSLSCLSSGSHWKRVQPGDMLNRVWPACSNDAFDAAMGVDAAKPESVVNLTGNKNAVLWAANIFLVAALAIFSRSLPVAVGRAG